MVLYYYDPNSKYISGSKNQVLENQRALNLKSKNPEELKKQQNDFKPKNAPEPQKNNYLKNFDYNGFEPKKTENVKINVKTDLVNSQKNINLKLSNKPITGRPKLSNLDYSPKEQNLTMSAKERVGKIVNESSSKTTKFQQFEKKIVQPKMKKAPVVAPPHKISSDIKAPSQKVVVDLNSDSPAPNQNDPAPKQNDPSLTQKEPVSVAEIKDYVPPSEMIVRIVCNFYDKPVGSPIWQKGEFQQKASTGYSFRLSDGTVMVATNGHAVKDCLTTADKKKMVTIVNHLNESFPGEVVMENDYTDLTFIALRENENEEMEVKAASRLREAAVDIPKNPRNIREIKFPSLRTGVVLKGYPGGNKALTLTTGKITTVCEMPYVLSATVGWTLGTDAVVASGNSGGPAFSDKGELLGMVFEGKDASFFLIPLPVVSATMERYEELAQKNYNKYIKMRILEPNVETQGITTQSSADFFGLQNGERGLRVVKDVGTLKADDVIVKAYGFPLNGDGSFIDNIFKNNPEEVPFSYRVMCMMLSEKHPYMDFEVVRNVGGKQERTNVRHMCSTSSDLVPKYLCEDSRDYLGMQGMSIVPLTINLIEQDMIQQSFSIPELVALVEGKKTFQNQTGLVLRVTPGTPLEEIYRPYHNSIVTEINGFSPRNLSEAIIATYRPIKNANGSFVTVRFSDNRLLVFDANVFMETNDRLNMAVGMENNYRSSIFSELKSCSCVSGALKIGQDHLICNICNQKMAEVATKDGMVSLKAYTPASNKVLEKELMKGGNNVVEEKMSGIAKEVSGRFGKAIYKGTTNEMREAVSPSTAVTM